MIRDHFRMLVVDHSFIKRKIVQLDGRNTEVGGGSLAALLFDKYGHPERPLDDPDYLNSLKKGYGNVNINLASSK